MTNRPHTGARLTGPTGNNAFAYEQRILADPDPKLRLPSVKAITNVTEIQLGTQPTFTELNDHNEVVIYTGLQHIYQTSFCTDAFSCVPTSLDITHHVPIYIFDNHNYALYFWAQQLTNDIRTYSVIHIDQHSDMGKPSGPLIGNGESCSQKGGEPCSPLQNIAYYTTHVCNVGNFIRPALDAGIITDCLWIKNDYDLEQTGGSYPQKNGEPCSTQQNTNKNLTPSQEGTKARYILDIDLDFRAPEMGTDLQTSIHLVQSLMRDASLITIATSPYFLNQTYALEILRKLLEK